MPACGAEFYRHLKDWEPLYSEPLGAAARDESPEQSVRVGGSTSIDLTEPGVDKARGVRKLRDVLGIGTDEMLLIGDALLAAKEAGAACVRVRDCEETKRLIETLLAYL